MSTDDKWERRAARREVVSETMSAVLSRATRRPSRIVLVGPYAFEFRRGRFFDLSEGLDINQRGISIVIRDANAGALGVAELSEWSISPATSPLEFWQVADFQSEEDANLAELIGSLWHRDDWPPLYGNVLVFSRLVIASGGSRDVLPALEQAMQTEFGRRVSVMALKAYPLEFESNLPVGAAEREGLFNRRRASMMRYYARRLKVEAIADQRSFPGWMWRAFRSSPAPLKRPSFRWLNKFGRR